jgi:hypothetical protein
VRTRAWKVSSVLVLITLAAAAPAGHASAGVPTRSRSISINFDDAPKKCLFTDTVALHGRYETEGVFFHGPTQHDGGGIVSEPCGNWGVTGYSPPNFLGFNVNGIYRDGGYALDPETLVFLTPVSHVQVNVARGGFVNDGLLFIRAFDSNWALVDSDHISLTATLTTVDVDGPGIAYVVLHGRVSAWVLDDLEAS